MNTIAERIKFAMKAKNKKQVDIVKDTGISKGAFSSYLSGQYNPKADKMELIADSLDVDLRWLYGQNVPMEHTSQNDNALQYVFYNNSCSEYLLDDLDDIYIAMMTQYAALIPRFYVLVNRAGNAMHILPLFLKEDSSQFYECPSDFFYSDRHTIFTRDFESIHMVLTTATIYYYGIDTATYEPKVTMLSYSQTDDCFHIDNGIQDGHIKAFEKELEKEALKYRQEHFDFGEQVINGSELFDKISSYSEWLEKVIANASLKTVDPNWVLTDTFFAVRVSDNKIVGIVDLRYRLNDFLKDFGNCGYSVRPSERRKGYATEILRQICLVAKEHGLKQLQLSVEKDNVASIKTIEKNGGEFSRSFIFENEEAYVYLLRL